MNLSSDSPVWKYLVDQGNYFHLILDRDAMIKYINKTWPKYTQEDVLDKCLWDWVSPEYLGVCKMSLQEVFLGVPQETQITLTDIDYGVLWFQMSFLPIRENGQVVASSLIMKDITTSVFTQHNLGTTMENLRSSNKRLDDFVSEVSHDLRSPLRIIGTYLDMALRFPSDPEKVTRYVGKCLQAYQSVDGMLQSLRDLTQIVTRGGKFQKVPLGTILTQISEVFPTVDLTLPEQLPEVWCDPHQITRVFQNLIENAVKYAHPDRPIKIVLGCIGRSESWYFTIQDNGLGIPQESQKKIYQVFYQENPNSQGMGVGLSICSKIVERHGNTIGVDSVLGKGSNFWFILPKKGIQ